LADPGAAARSTDPKFLRFLRGSRHIQGFQRVVLDTSEGDRIADSLGRRKSVILQNHGILTVGPSVEAAV
jgi:ribulose-5-phosphate 4-epimerase/fuculose-1-phosphate aldolase